MLRTRRDLLRVGGIALATGIAGCFGSNDSPTEDGTSDETDLVTSLPTPTLGPDDAPVTVAVYEDYACPHCKTYALDTLPKIRSEYVTEGIVRYEHHDFPIPVDDRWSWQAASAARGVQETVDVEAFFDFSTALYENQGSFSLDLIESLAEEVGADPAPIRTAADDEVYRRVLESDREQGLDAGVEGTPTVLVNGSDTSRYDWDTVSRAIESARP
ncbi:MAG: DsbA family protein [archaeon]